MALYEGFFNNRISYLDMITEAAWLLSKGTEIVVRKPGFDFQLRYSLAV